MFKPTEYKIELSNLALFGSDVEKKVKLESAETEPAWKKAGKKVGLEIWRIKEFKVLPLPKEQYGAFYSGDSYIVMNTHGDPNNLNWDIHFWLGAFTTQDEAGTAAYKTAELDTLLGGKPIQHRQVQGFESPLFLSYFGEKGGIRILSGGYDSGFHHVQAASYTPRLFWIKGKKHVRVLEVPLRWDSLNHGDSFILDAGLKIFVWNGSKSGIFEKSTAIKTAKAIDDERGGKPETVTLSDGETGPLSEFIPSGTGEIKEDGGADELPATVRHVYRLSDSSGSLTFTEVITSESLLDHSVLDSNDVFVVDVTHEIFSWIGKGASISEKQNAMHYATEYLKNHQRPIFLPITIVIEGKETPNFHSHFKK